MEDITVQRTIISILEKAHLPLTSKEISLYGNLNINSTRKILQDLYNSGDIQSIPMGKGKKNLYMHNPSKEDSELKILIIGKWIKRDLDVLNEYKKKEKNEKIVEKYNENIEEQTNSESIMKCNLFQGVGFINFYDLRKICGVHRFHTKEKIHKIGVQRAKKEIWVKQLESALKDPKAEMWSTAIVYFDQDKVDYIKLQDYEDREIGTLIINYSEHVFDENKPGWILDGQQRMWALESIAIQEKKPIVRKLLGPITIAIGEFNNDNQKGKLDFIRRTFSNSNNTKNLPQNFRDELISTLDSSSQEILTEEDKLRGLIASMIDELSINEDSPFRDLIDKSKLGLSRKQSELIPAGDLRSIIKVLLNYEGFQMGELPMPKDDDRFIFNIELIKDYFNAIKFTFSFEWEKPINESKIRSRLVLSSFAELLMKILHISIARSPDRQNRFKSMVTELLKISEDEEVSFDIESALISSLRDNLGDIKKLTESLIKIYTDNSQVIPDQSTIDEILDEWISLSPRNQISI